VATYPICVTLTGFNVLLIALYSASGLALLIYIPAAVYLSIKDSNSRFDRAGREVAYLSVQLALYLGKS
jgi:hypothetical protein